MLTGRLPFVSDDPLALVLLHRDEPPPHVADLRPDAPSALAGTADAALAKDPAQRPQDGAALLALLEGAAAPAALADADPTRVLPAAAGRRSRFGARLAVAVLALLALAGGVLAYEVTRPGDAPAPAATAATTQGVSSPTQSTPTTLPATTQPASTTAATQTTIPTTRPATTTRRTTTQPAITTVYTTTFATTTAVSPTTSFTTTPTDTTDTATALP